MISLALWIVAYAMVAAAVYLYSCDVFTAATLPLIAYLFAVVASQIVEVVEVIAL